MATLMLGCEPRHASAPHRLVWGSHDTVEPTTFSVRVARLQKEASLNSFIPKRNRYVVQKAREWSETSPKFLALLVGVWPLVLQNHVLCWSRFWTSGREAGGSRSKNLPKAPWKQMLGQGHTLRLLDEAQEVRRHQHPGPENQDSEHMLDQPRGSFPDSWRTLCKNILHWCSGPSLTRIHEKIVEEVFETCICTCAPPLYMDIVAVFTYTRSQYVKIFRGINFGVHANP